MYEKLQFDYARDSLGYLIKAFDLKELYLPYYLCDVIQHRVVKELCRPIYYHIDDNFYPAEEFDKEKFILYPNYFGICEDNVNKLETIYPKLIVDNAHAYYIPPQGFACFNSAKKFLPVEKGSALYIKKGTKKGGKTFVAQKFCPRRDNDINFYPQIRREEFKLINKKYKKTNNIKFKDIPKSPFCYPYLASTEEEADRVAKELTAEGKTIYRYWNPLPKSYNEYKFYSRLVPIPLAPNLEVANNIRQDNLLHQRDAQGT